LLAAGKGSRMDSLSKFLPKPMLPVGNKPLLVHQIELLRQLGITDIHVLIGHKGYEIARVLGNGSQYGVSINYVEQTEMLGIAHAVGQLESVVDKPFMLFLGDIFFVPKDLESMVTRFEEQAGGAVLAVKMEPDTLAIRRNYSVQMNDEGRVVRVIEKPRHVPNKLKGVGLYLFDLTMFDAIRRTPRTAMRDEYEITEAIQVLINDGEFVSAVEAVHDDVNLTFPADVLRVNMEYLETVRAAVGDNLVGDGADIHPGATLKNSVVGAGVKITAPATLENCVLFDGATVDCAHSYRNSLFMGDKVVGCQARSEGE
jgi:dTDP-glucose pyrophosphorylase